MDDDRTYKPESDAARDALRASITRNLREERTMKVPKKVFHQLETTIDLYQRVKDELSRMSPEELVQIVASQTAMEVDDIRKAKLVDAEVRSDAVVLQYQTGGQRFTLSYEKGRVAPVVQL